MDIWFELLSFIAAAFELLGIYLLGHRHRIGFISNMFAGILWILYVILSKNTFGLLMICSVALVLNFKGFRMWSKSEKEKKDIDHGVIV